MITRTSGSIPNIPSIILLVSDQGALVTTNTGQTWSSWYNQPTGQLYHVATSNTFPYLVCSGQQDSGSVCVSSRGRDGEITFRDWHPSPKPPPNPMPVHVLKSLQCWMYQCAEGEIPNQALYLAFRNIERVLACLIVSELPEYKETEWR